MKRKFRIESYLTIVVILLIAVSYLVYNFGFSLIKVGDTVTNTNELIAYVDSTTTTSTTTSNSTKTTTSTTTKKKTTKKSTTTTTTTSKQYYEIAETKAGANSKYIKRTNNQLKKVPKKVIDAFKSEKWHIYISTEKLADTYFDGKYKSVEGVTDYGHKQIIIEDRNKAIDESTIHELGHFLDYYLTYTSDSDEWTQIYNEEVETFKDRISNPGCVSNKEEFFAETFYYMYTDSSKCTPKAKEYILEKINEL